MVAPIVPFLPKLIYCSTELLALDPLNIAINNDTIVVVASQNPRFFHRSLAAFSGINSGFWGSVVKAVDSAVAVRPSHGAPVPPMPARPAGGVALCLRQGPFFALLYTFTHCPPLRKATGRGGGYLHRCAEYYSFGS